MELDPDANATINDGSCLYPVDIYGDPTVDCDGVCINDVDGDGVCDENEITGCTDDMACNYQPSATEDDLDACDYSCYGCTDEDAANYDPAATIDDGCEYCALTINPDVIITDVVCAGEMNGSILLNGSTGGFGQVFYGVEGSILSDIEIIDGLSGGSYKVVAMDSLMCTDTLSVTINEPEALASLLPRTSRAMMAAMDRLWSHRKVARALSHSNWGRQATLTVNCRIGCRSVHGIWHG